MPPSLPLAERNIAVGAGAETSARASVTPGVSKSRSDLDMAAPTSPGKPAAQPAMKPAVLDVQGGAGTGTALKSAPKGILRTESGVKIPPAHFDHLLTFPEEIAPVFDMLRDEHEERRLLDHVRNREATRYLERLNEELDVAQRERQESDILLDKINNTRLDALQKKLVRLINKGFQELHEELDDAKERMRINTEKLHQLEVDAEIERKQLMRHFHEQVFCLTSCCVVLYYTCRQADYRQYDTICTIPQTVRQLHRQARGDVQAASARR